MLYGRVRVCVWCHRIKIRKTNTHTLSHTTQHNTRAHTPGNSIVTDEEQVLEDGSKVGQRRRALDETLDGVEAVLGGLQLKLEVVVPRLQLGQVFFHLPVPHVKLNMRVVRSSKRKGGGQKRG